MIKLKVIKQINTIFTIVEVFKTNVSNQHLANRIITDLNQLYPNYRINFDLEDCDKILRIESYNAIDVLGIINYGKYKSIQIKLIN